MNEIQAALYKLPPNKKKVAFIVEDDPVFSQTLAESFLRRGYQVFIETSPERAKSKLQVLDITKTRVDIASVSSKNKTSSHFIKYLHQKYDDIKIVMFKESHKEDLETEAAIADKDSNIEIITDTMHKASTLNYSQELLKKHFSDLRELDRTEKMEAKINSCLKGRNSYTPEQIAQWNELRIRVRKSIAILFYKTFEAETLHLRKFYWRELLKHSKMIKFTIKIAHIRSLLKRYKEINGDLKHRILLNIAA